MTAVELNFEMELKFKMEFWNWKKKMSGAITIISIIILNVW